MCYLFESEFFHFSFIHKYSTIYGKLDLVFNFFYFFIFGGKIRCFNWRHHWQIPPLHYCNYGFFFFFTLTSLIYHMIFAVSCKDSWSLNPSCEDCYSWEYHQDGMFLHHKQLRLWETWHNHRCWFNTDFERFIFGFVSITSKKLIILWFNH